MTIRDPNTNTTDTTGTTNPTTDPRTLDPRTLTEQQRIAALQQLQNQFNNEFTGSLDTAFTDPAMRARFNQLNLQFQGLGAFNNPTLQRQLNLTAQQRQQLAALNGEWRRALMGLRRDSRGDLTQEQFNALRTQFANRLNAILSAQQQQQWAQLTGQRFDFPFNVFLPPADQREFVPKTTPSRAAQTPQTPTVR